MVILPFVRKHFLPSPKTFVARDRCQITIFWYWTHNSDVLQQQNFARINEPSGCTHTRHRQEVGY